MSQETIRRRERLYLDGEWVDAGEAIDVEDLAAGGIFAQVAAAGTEEAERALAAADRARSPMRTTSIPQRVRWLEAIADGLLDRRDELAEVIVREAGKPISSARGEVESAAKRFRLAAGEARDLQGEFRRGTTDGHEGWEAIVKPEPAGVVLAITPFNYPLSTAALKIAPALAAGNAVVFKPASKTPISGAILTDVIAEVGLPDGAFNFVPGSAGVIGDKLAGDDRVNVIAMTGSSAAGKHVAKESGMVQLQMELGGNAPAVIFPDADLEEASAASAKGALKYAGQRCSAISRVLAHESVHDDLVERIETAMDQWTVGDLFEDETDLGPLISEDDAEHVQGLIDDALDRGGRLVRGGSRDGNFVEPTLIADVPHDARLVVEETFGPVITVTTFETEAEALRVANGTDLALDACVFTADYDRARRVADELEAGAVRINGAPSHGLGDVPFGGNEDSGIGREGLGVTIEEMTTTKSIIL